MGHTKLSLLEISITKDSRSEDTLLYGIELGFGPGFLGIMPGIQAYLYCASHLLTLCRLTERISATSPIFPFFESISNNIFSLSSIYA